MPGENLCRPGGVLRRVFSFSTTEILQLLTAEAHIQGKLPAQSNKLSIHRLCSYF